jgi:hypothetical protein
MNFRDLPGTSSNPVPKHLLDRVESALLADLQPVKPVASVLRTTLSLLIFATLVVAAAIRRLGLAGWNSFSWLQASIVLGILAFSMCLLAHLVSTQMTPGSKRPFSPVLLLALPAVALAVASAMLFPAEAIPGFLSVGFRCWRAGAVCAACTAPMFWLMLRRGFALAPVQHGATAGLLAGLTGVTILTIECSYLDRLHLIVWHLGAGLTAMAIGACIGCVARARRQRLA